MTAGNNNPHTSLKLSPSSLRKDCSSRKDPPLDPRRLSPTGRSRTMTMSCRRTAADQGPRTGSGGCWRGRGSKEGRVALRIASVSSSIRLCAHHTKSSTSSKLPSHNWFLPRRDRGGGHEKWHATRGFDQDLG